MFSSPAPRVIHIVTSRPVGSDRPFPAHTAPTPPPRSPTSPPFVCSCAALPLPPAAETGRPGRRSAFAIPTTWRAPTAEDERGREGECGGTGRGGIRRGLIDGSTRTWLTACPTRSTKSLALPLGKRRTPFSRTGAFDHIVSPLNPPCPRRTSSKNVLIIQHFFGLPLKRGCGRCHQCCI